MDDKVKAQIIIEGVEILFTRGLPALFKMISILNNKEKVTIEDVKNLRGDLDASTYFDGDFK